jgi:acyl carrier protein
VLRGLVRTPAKRASAAGGSWSSRLTALPAEQRRDAAVQLVRAQVAGALGHDSADLVDPARPFRDLGFDSLSAVELRNSLNAATGLRLPPTVVFDHPTTVALAEYVLAELNPPAEARPMISGQAASATAVLAELDRIEAALRAIPAEDGQRGGVGARLRALTAAWAQMAEPEERQDPAAGLDAASADEIFDFIDKQLGRQ